MNTLLALVSGFASGVFLRSLFNSGGLLALIFLLLFSCAAAAHRWKGKEHYRLAAIFCAFVALGVIRMHYAETPLPKLFADDLRQRVVYTGTVTSDPDIRDKNQRVPIRVTRGDETTIILAVAGLSPTIEVGDRVRVSGILTRPQPFDTEGGRVFRYDKYLEKDGIRFLLNFATVMPIEPAPWHSLPTYLARVKHRFLDVLAQVLPHPQSALASGLIIGGKRALGEDLQEAFIKSGLVQIVVLSGYNVMIIAEWTMVLLGLFALSRGKQAAAGASALLLFVGIAGFSSTAIRATLMALIALYARATGKSYSAGRALFVAVFCMLAWNPFFLLYDPGFGLSVSATAGLIWLSPFIERKLLWIKRSALREAVTTTLAAQLAVLPLLLYQTGNLSLVALPANIIAMPFVPLTMAFSALAVVAGMVFGSQLPVVAVILASPAYVGTTLLIELAERLTALPWSAVILPAFPFWLAMIAYAALVAIAWSKRFSITDQLTLAKKAST